MATHSQRITRGLESIGREQSAQPGQFEQEIPPVNPNSKERQAQIDRIVSQRNVPLIEAGIEAYRRDLPRLLNENRYQQWVADRGSELVAFGPTYRRLRKKLEKMGFANMGEFFMSNVAPLEIDEDEADVPDRSLKPDCGEPDIPFPSPITKERQAEIDRIVSQKNLPLIEAGIEAYKHDLPQLLMENRYRQWVAYRGSEMVAFGSTRRQLRRLEEKGFTNMGEIFRISVAPLEIDEDEFEPSPTTLPPSR